MREQCHFLMIGGDVEDGEVFSYATEIMRFNLGNSLIGGKEVRMICGSFPNDNG